LVIDISLLKLEECRDRLQVGSLIGHLLTGLDGLTLLPGAAKRVQITTRRRRGSLLDENNMDHGHRQT